VSADAVVTGRGLPWIAERAVIVLDLGLISAEPGQEGERVSESRPAILGTDGPETALRYERWQPKIIVESAPTDFAISRQSMDIHAPLVDGNKLMLSLEVGSDRDARGWRQIWSEVVGMTTGPVTAPAVWLPPSVAPTQCRLRWAAHLYARHPGWKFSATVLADVVERDVKDHVTTWAA
jgi:hypothetical protein